MQLDFFINPTEFDADAKQESRIKPAIQTNIRLVWRHIVPVYDRQQIYQFLLDEGHHGT